MTEEETKTGKILERQVAQAYREMGARKVEHDVELNGHQIDVYVELETADRSLHRIAVEVKDYARPVGIKIMRDFSKTVDHLRRERLIDEGVTVSAGGFSRPARNTAKAEDIRLLEPGDLEAMVAEAECEGRRVPPTYTPPTPPDPDRDPVPEPGPLPPGHRMPFGQNALFTGRVEPLKTLARALLHQAGQSALITQAIAGMGGVGKTQLAVEFAYRYGRFFDGVHWLNAREPTGLRAEVAACGAEMCLPHWPERLPGQVARTLETWRRGGRRLVVLDNLEGVSAAREWLGRLGGGRVRVLVTARRSDWPRDLGLRLLRLEVFAPEESRAFLRGYLPEKRSTDAELDRLAERLGHLPLALELAGRYLGGLPRVTVTEYLEMLEQVWAHPSMAGWREEMGNPTGHDLDLAQTFAASWERVEDEAARRVFLTTGYCAPNQPIPCQVLEEATGLDTEGCDAAVGVLAGMGLVEVEDAETGPVVHPLLGEYARAVAASGRHEPEVLGAVAGVLGTLAYKANRTDLPARFAPLRPHVEAMAAAAEEAKLEDAGSLWNELGVHLRMMADYAGARVALERALATDEWVYGPEHPEVAINFNNLGMVLQDLGDLVGARAAYEQALAIGERVYGPEHPKVALRINNLGGVLQELGDLVGARAAIERALGIFEKVLGPDHPNVATLVNNLGMVLWDIDDLAGARTAFERALEIWQAAYGDEHPQVATGHNNLGGVLREMGELAGARAAYKRALTIDERVYGPEHPNVAIRVNNLGLVLQALGDLPGARAAFERALEILETCLPEGHPHIEKMQVNLLTVLLELVGGDVADD